MSYAPHRSDLIWLQFDPQRGHEQAGRRPALVLSPHSYHLRAGLAVLCPVTTRKKGYPFEVALPIGFPISGVVLADQARSLDWDARQSEYICAAPDSIVSEVKSKLKLLIS